MADTRIWGTLTNNQVEVLREFAQRFIEICPDGPGRSPGRSEADRQGEEDFVCGVNSANLRQLA